MTKKGFPEVIVRALMSLYRGASNVKVRVESELSEKFFVQVSVYQGSVLSSLLFAL